MVNVIQSDQLSPVSGSYGQTRVVQEPALGQAVSQAVTGTLQVADMASSVYAKNKGQAMVEEAIQDVDAARAAASLPGASLDEVPESVRLAQDEWTNLAAAVRSGNLSRDKAQLIAASALRRRISEDPLFAEKLRSAASGVLGFNITSLPAQAYFASIPTAASLGAGSGAPKRDMTELGQAREWGQAQFAAGNYASPEAATKHFLDTKKAAVDAEYLATSIQAGNASAEAATDKLLSDNYSVLWGNVIGKMQAAKENDGESFKAPEFLKLIKAGQAESKEVFTRTWEKAGGTINSEDYDKAIARFDKQYKEISDFATEYGFDNLQKLGLERMHRAYQVMGSQLNPQITYLKEAFGDSIATFYLEQSTMTDAKLEILKKKNPAINALFNTGSMSNDQFRKVVADTTAAFYRGEEIPAETSALVDTVVTEAVNKGGEAETRTLKELSNRGLDWKGMSAALRKGPQNSNQETMAMVKSKYSTMFEPAVSQLVESVATEPTIALDITDSGEIVVNRVSRADLIKNPAFQASVADPSNAMKTDAAYRKAQDLAKRLNVFAKAHKSGWSSVFDESLEDYTMRLTDTVDSNKMQAMDRAEENLVDQITNNVRSGNVAAAKQLYNRLQVLSPSVYKDSFEETIKKAQ